jgi:hypothetical protein
MAKEHINETNWAAVAARAQAYQAMHLAGLNEKTVTEKAQFLMALGITRTEAAALLGSSDDSLRILFRRAAAKDAATGRPAKNMTNAE